MLIIYIEPTARESTARYLAQTLSSKSLVARRTCKNDITVYRVQHLSPNWRKYSLALGCGWGRGTANYPNLTNLRKTLNRRSRDWLAASEKKNGYDWTMIIPIRCFTCGKVIGNKWESYLDLLQAEYTEGCVTTAYLMCVCTCVWGGGGGEIGSSIHCLLSLFLFERVSYIHQL